MSRAETDIGDKQINSNRQYIVLSLGKPLKLNIILDDTLS